MSEINLSEIEKMIYLVRKQKVMLDSDLADLYGISNKRLIEQVQRNRKRFPEDFMFQCNSDDLNDLRSQFASATTVKYWNFKRKTMPFLFTETGVAMLSSVLNSDQAIEINISIIRIFIKLRSFVAIENTTTQDIKTLEKNTNKLFKIVFERMDSKEVVMPKLQPNRKKIGLKDS